MSIFFAGTNQKVARTSGVPAYGAFTICAWAVRQVKNTNFDTVCALGSLAATHQFAIGWQNESTDVGLRMSGSASAQIGTLDPKAGEVFFVAIAGIDASHSIGYARLASQSVLSNSGSVSNGGGTPTEMVVGTSAYDGTDYLRGFVWAFKAWNRNLTEREILIESNAHHVVDARDVHLYWSLRKVGDYNDPLRGRRGTRTGTLQNGPERVVLNRPVRSRARDLDGFVSSGATTRGLPFGNRGTAFNGGRTFVGPILN